MRRFIFGIPHSSKIELVEHVRDARTVFLQCRNLTSSRVSTPRTKPDNSRAVVAVGRFYIALFSALEQTHCAIVACDCE